MSQSEYTNISKKVLYKALKTLTRNTQLQIIRATKHSHKLDYPGARSYPLALNHSKMMGWVVDDVVKWLVANEICSKEEFHTALKIRR